MRAHGFGDPRRSTGARIVTSALSLMLFAPILLVLLGLTGCGQTATGALTSSSSAAQIEYAMQSDFLGLQEVAKKYNQLPRCTAPNAPTICSDLAVVTEIRKADDAAVLAFKAAQKIVNDKSSSASALSKALGDAGVAVEALQAILLRYGLK